MNTARFNVQLSGHAASVTLSMDGGKFSGLIESADYGTGNIKDGVQTGDSLAGTVSLDGYDADFSAKLDGNNINGRVKYGWLFSADFTGSRAV